MHTILERQLFVPLMRKQIIIDIYFWNWMLRTIEWMASARWWVQLESIKYFMIFSLFNDSTEILSIKIDLVWIAISHNSFNAISIERCHKNQSVRKTLLGFLLQLKILFSLFDGDLPFDMIGATTMKAKKKHCELWVLLTFNLYDLILK